MMKKAQKLLVLCLACCWGTLAWGQGLSPAAKFAAHTGSRDDPYLVENAADWNYLSEKSADNMWYKGKYIHLKADLNGQQLKVFESLQGVFDGEGHTVSNFHLDLKTDGMRAYNAGLFRGLGSDATLRNLVVRGAKIVSTGARIEKSGVSIGLVVGSHAGVLDRVTLLESSIDILGSVDGAEYNETNVGALVGWGGDGSQIRNCQAKNCTIRCGNSYLCVGGIAGSSSATMYNNQWSGTITIGKSAAKTVAKVGGLCGYSGAPIEGCGAEGSIKAEYDPAGGIYGGLIGRTQRGVIRSFARVSLELLKVECAGGFVGTSSAYTDEPSTYVDCYALGGVKATEGYLGGFVGKVELLGEKAIFTRCYANAEVAQVTAPAGGSRPFARIFRPVAPDNYEFKEIESADYAGSSLEKYFASCYANPSLGAAQSGVLLSDALSQQGTYQGFDFGSTWFWDESLKTLRLQWERGDPEPPKGKGTKDEPYLIETLAHLRWLSQNDDLWGKGLYFQQTASIDATETGEWNIGADGSYAYPFGFSPIGTAVYPFRGVYDGGGHLIKGLYIRRESADMVGLFGYAKLDKAEYGITGVHLVDATVVGNSHTGALVGHVDGGLGLVSDCSAQVVLVKGYMVVGGLVGSLGARGSRLSVNAATDTSRVKAFDTVGGLFGTCGAGSYDRAIELCYSSIDVENNSTVSGGFASISTAPTTIRNCYSTGAIFVSYYEFSTPEAAAGGFMSNGKKCRFESCYAAGPTVNIYNAENPKLLLKQGFVQAGGGATFKHCYFQTDHPKYGKDPVTNAPNTTPGQCEGKTRAELTSGKPLNGFANDVWTFVANEYPLLQSLSAGRILYGVVDGGSLAVTRNGKTVENKAGVLVGRAINMVLTPAEGYEVAWLKVNGLQLTAVDGQYSWNVVGGDNVITYDFRLKSPDAVEVRLARVLVAPMPCTTELRVLNAGEVASYTLYSVGGQPVLEGRNAHEAVISLSVGTLADGIYLLQLRSADGAARTLRVVKQ